jgi:hypothetical protein
MIQHIDPDLESTLFYSMSTIAQTLAGAIGLLGAIVLFALQATSRSIDRAAKRLSEMPHSSLSALYIRHLFTRRSYQEIADRYGEMLSSANELSTEILVYHSTLTWELQHENAIRRSFWKALLASGTIIVVAFIGVTLAPQLAAHQRLGNGVLIVTVLGATMCMVLYGILFRIVLNSTAEKMMDSKAPKRK